MRRSRAAVIGWILLAAAALFAGGTEYALQRDLRQAATVLATPGAPAEIRASATYHSVHAERQRRARWRLTGHGTLGVLATVAGIAVIASSRRRISTGDA